MADVDEKVVQLTLDNKSFTKDTDQTIKSLDELKESLKFEGIGKGFDDITTAASKVDVSPVAKGVEQIGVKFNALATIADAALRNITTKALDSGERLIKSLSIDQITSGWSKFEDKTKSVATLLAQGFSLEEVNAQLDKLNWFTDETSYNFTDMVANISKFTATGKGLEESNVAMQGIALWAALSGQNAQTASHAMYQLSQALGAGTMRLEDYRSIQNASMDTDEFRQKALDAAVALGTLEKVGEDAYRSLVGGGDAFSKAQFASSLTEGAWFTSDVMMQVFKTYSSAVDEIYAYAEEKGITASEAMKELEGTVDAFGIKAFKAGQEARSLGDALDSVKDAVSTGWMKTFELIIGDSREATQLFTDMANALYDVFAEGGNARNEILQQWKDLGGRDVFIESLYKLAENLYEIVQTVKDAFHDIFPPMTLETVVNLTNSFARFAAHLKLSDSALSSIRSAISGVLSVARGGIVVLKTVFKALSPIFQVLNVGSGLILELAGNIGKLLKSGIDKNTSAKNLEKLYTVINSIAKVIAGIAGGSIGLLVEGATKIFDIVSKIWDRFSNEGGGITGFIKIVSDELYNLWDSFVYGDTLLNKIVDGALLGVGLIASAIGGLVDIVVGLIRGEDLDLSAKFGDLGRWAETIMGDINASGVSNIFDKITQSLGNFITTLITFINDLFTAESDIRTIIKNLGDDFKWLYELVKDWLMDLSVQDIQGFIVIFMLWQLVSSLKQVNVAIKGTFTALSGTFKAATNVVKEFSDPKANFVEQLNGVFNKTKILQIGIAALLLVQSLRILTEMDEQKLVNSVLILGSVAAIMVAVMKRFQKMAEAAPKKEGGDNKGLGFAAQFLAISAGVLMIAKAAQEIVKIVSENDFGTWATAVGVLTLFMGELIGVVWTVDKLSSGSKNLLSSAAVIVAMAGAIRLIGSAVMMFDGKSLDDIGAGILAVATTLVALGGAAALIGTANWKNLLAGTTAIAALSGAIFTMSVSIAALSNIEKAMDGVKALGVALLELTASFALIALATKLTKPTDILAASVALTALGAASLSLAASMVILAAIPYSALEAGMMSFVVALTAIAGLALANALTGGGVLAAAAALAALGVAAAGLGAGLLLGAQACIKFVEAGALFVGFVIALGQIITKMGDEWPTIIDNAFKALYRIFSDFLLMIVALSPQMSMAAAAVIGSIALGITMAGGEIIGAISGIAVGLLSMIASLADPLMDALIKIVNVLTDRAPELIEAIGELIVVLMQGVGYLLRKAIEGLGAMVYALITGDMNSMFDDLSADAQVLAEKYLKTLSSSMGEDVDETMRKLGIDAGDQYARGIIAGLQAGEYDTQQAAILLAQRADEAAKGPNGFDEHSPSVRGQEGGEYYAEGVAVGIEKGTEKYAVPAAEDMATQTTDTMANTIAEGGDKITQALYDVMSDGAAGFDTSQFEGYFKMPGMFDLSESYNQLNQLERRAGELGAEAVSRSQGKSTWEDRKFKIEPKEQKEINNAYEESGEEAGKEFDQGVSSGIKKSGAGTAAAKSQAEKIKDAFQESFDNMQLDESIDDLLYKLWGAQNPNANEAQKTAMEIEYNNRKLNYAQGELKNYQQIYEQTVKAYGESSKEAVTALKDFIQAQTDVLDLQNKIAELQGNMVSTSTENTKAFTKFSEAVSESYTYLKEAGFSNEQIRDALAKETGWKQPLTEAAKNLEQEGEAAATASANNVSGTYFETLLNGITVNIPRLSEQGKAATKAVADGMKNNVGLIETASNEIAQTTIETTMPSWLEVGKQVDAGMEKGISDNADLPATASADMTNQTIEASKQAADINSPSGQFIYIGQMMMEGLRMGIMEKAGEIAQAAASVVSQAIAAAKAAGGIHSPSREGIYIGEMFDRGLLIGLDNYGHYVASAAERIVSDANNAAVSSVKNLGSRLSQRLGDLTDASNEIDIVVNLDDREATKTLAALRKMGDFEAKWSVSEGNPTQNVNGDDVMNNVQLKHTDRVLERASYSVEKLARAFATYTSVKEISAVSVAQKPDATPTVVTYNQNITSPKPVSRLDTYRDTKKLLEMTYKNATKTPSGPRFPKTK